MRKYSNCVRYTFEDRREREREENRGKFVPFQFNFSKSTGRRLSLERLFKYHIACERAKSKVTSRRQGGEQAEGDDRSTERSALGTCIIVNDIALGQTRVTHTPRSLYTLSTVCEPIACTRSVTLGREERGYKAKGVARFVIQSRANNLPSSLIHRPQERVCVVYYNSSYASRQCNLSTLPYVLLTFLLLQFFKFLAHVSRLNVLSSWRVTIFILTFFIVILSSNYVKLRFERNFMESRMKNQRYFVSRETMFYAFRDSILINFFLHTSP